MKVLLYPYHYLEPMEYLSDSEKASIASSLLYFESVTMGRPGSPEQLGLPTSIEEISHEMQQIEKAHGIDAIDQWLSGGHHDPDFSCDDVAVLNYQLYRTKIAHSENVYKPLIQEGVIQFTTLSEQLPEFSFSEFVHVLDEFDDWPNSENEVENFAEAVSDAGSIGLSAYHLRDIMKAENAELLDRTDGDAKLMHWRTAFLMDVFSQSLISAKLNLPLTSFSELHFIFRDRCISKLRNSSLVSGAVSKPSAESIAQQLFAKTLISLPVILPRSPEAILFIRESLKDELQEFRGAVFDTAEELLKESADSVTEKDIENIVRQRFIRPTEALHRKLAHPNRDLAQNLLSNNSVGAGLVSFFGLSAGLGASTICSAVLALAVPTLTASIKTLLERQREVEQSGLAFLVKSRQSSVG